jgi:hypothetical protein
MEYFFSVSLREEGEEKEKKNVEEKAQKGKITSELT